MDANKASDDRYLPAAKALLASMERNGFDPQWPIPIDPDGEILGGAHRLACALALRIKVTADPMVRRAWAPPWGMEWFIDNGMETADLERLRRDWLKLKS